MPQDQVRQFNRLIDLMNTAHSRLAFLIMFIEAAETINRRSTGRSKSPGSRTDSLDSGCALASFLQAKGDGCSERL